MSGRTCGTCRWCERWDEGSGVAYDPWSELEEPLRTTMREKEERRATADARIAANPRLVRHKFRKV